MPCKGYQSITLSEAPEIDDYRFEGWFLDDGIWNQPFTEDYFADKAITEDVNVYAKYVYEPSAPPAPTEYDITFYAFGEVVDTVTTAGNESVILPTAPARENYEFIGWYLDENVWNQQFTVDYFADKVLTGDVKVYARYDYTEPEPEKHGIIFYVDGMVWTVLQTTGFVMLELPDAPEKVNYEFIGWYFNDGVWNVPFTEDYCADKALTQDVSVYARYEPTEYKITFDTDGGSAVAPVTVDVLETSPVTTKAGYTFVGWYSDPEKTVAVSFPYRPTADCTLFAKWGIDDSIFRLDATNKISGLKKTPADGKIYVPEYVEGVKVAGIATDAFKKNVNLVSVEFDPAITDLGIRMFQDCTSLKEVIIPDTVTTIPSKAFDYCTSLESIELPSSITTISASAFYMSGLKSITLPDSVLFVGESAFSGCKDLTYVDLGSVREMQQGVFKNCTQLTSVEFPDTLQAFDSNYTFNGCTNLTEIIYPDIPLPLTYTFAMGSAYYKNASNWEDGALYVGNHLVTVDSTFAKTSFTVRSGTVTVGKLALYQARNSATKLISVTIPEGVKAIGENAFSYCDALSSVNIPDSVIRIYENAFPASAIGSDGYIGKWLIKYNLTGTAVSVKEGTVGIADGKLTSAHESVTSVSLPSTLRYIGANNFYFMTQLTTIDIPASLVAVWDNAFSGCSALQTLDFTECGNLQIIGEFAFSSCKAVNELFIPESVVQIGEFAFNYFTGTLYVQRGQDEIPVGWHPKWKSTYGKAVNVVWNA